MRKFKHKQTHFEATQIDCSTYRLQYWKHPVPSHMIEKSEDWEEVIEKKPLFVTEDGVEVFEGDRYHSVSYTDYTYKGNYISENPNCGKYTDPRSYKTFATREAAKQYIDLHKPKYSLKDVEEAIENTQIMWSSRPVIDNLKKLNK